MTKLMLAEVLQKTAVKAGFIAVRTSALEIIHKLNSKTFFIYPNITKRNV